MELLEVDTFDLILLDLKMPGLDGVSVVEVLRKWGHDTPILMINGFGTVDTAVDALHTGADDFLTKPVEPDVLSARVDVLLSRRPTPSNFDEPPRRLARPFFRYQVRPRDRGARRTHQRYRPGHRRDRDR